MQITAAEHPVANFREELKRIESSIALPGKRVELMSDTLLSQRKLQTAGFLSDLGLQQKEQDLLSERAALEAANRSFTATSRDLDGALVEARVLRAKQDRELSESRLGARRLNKSGWKAKAGGNCMSGRRSAESSQPLSPMRAEA